jgi:hypothetical protein
MDKAEGGRDVCKILVEKFEEENHSEVFGID